MAPLTILITGGTAGFGLQFSQHALKKGHKIIATARNVARAQKANPEIEESGGIWLELDVTGRDTREKISTAVSKYNVDVVINNAGFSHCGIVEDATAEEVEAQFRTNVFGPIQVIQGALPHFRERKSGVIVNLSSIVGIQPAPGAALYSASKGAIDALTDALAAELAPFGIKVLNVTPGAFRTRFLASNSATIAQYSEPYKGTTGAQVIDALAGRDGKQEGDPQKGVERMLDFIVGEGSAGKATEGGRLFIGSDSKGSAQSAIEKLQNAWKVSEEAAMSCDVDEP